MSRRLEQIPTKSWNISALVPPGKQTTRAKVERELDRMRPEFIRWHHKHGPMYRTTEREVENLRWMLDGLADGQCLSTATQFDPEQVVFATQLAYRKSTSVWRENNLFHVCEAWRFYLDFLGGTGRWPRPTEQLVWMKDAVDALRQESDYISPMPRTAELMADPNIAELIKMPISVYVRSFVELHQREKTRNPRQHEASRLATITLKSLDDPALSDVEPQRRAWVIRAVIEVLDTVGVLGTALELDRQSKDIISGFRQVDTRAGASLLALILGQVLVELLDTLSAAGRGRVEAMYLVQEWLYAAAEGEPEPEEDPRCGFGTPDDHQEAKALMRQLRALGLVRTGKTLALPELLKETVRSEYGDEDEEEYDEYEDYDEEDFDEAV